MRRQMCIFAAESKTKKYRSYPPPTNQQEQLLNGLTGTYFSENWSRCLFSCLGVTTAVNLGIGRVQRRLNKKPFGKYRKENLRYLEESEKEICAWLVSG